MITKETRGRKKKVIPVFDLSTVKTTTGNKLEFDGSLFIPIKTNRELDIILSTDGGLMPGTNMMIAGGPGSGKTTVCLDILSCFVPQAYKVLFISGEMDDIGYFKYCKRIPKFGNIETLFLKDYSLNAKEVLEYIFSQGYEVVVIDSVAEVISMVKAQTKMTETQVENWLLELQDKNKKGLNDSGVYTTFINIQQVTKSNDFVGSNRLKHMMDAYAFVDVSKDALERTIKFEKNRDCDKLFKVAFTIRKDDIYYAYVTDKEDN